MFDKITSATKEFGLSDGLGYVVDRVLYDRLKIGGFARYLLTAQPIHDPAALRPGKLEIRELLAGDPLLKTLPLDDKVLAFRFAQGAVCLAAIESKDDQASAVACIWFTFGTYLEDMVRCRYVMYPPEQTAWDFDVYVAPDHRMGRTFARLWDAANAYLRGRGVAWSLSRISAYNPASLKSHARLGAQVVGRATFLVIGPFQLMWSSVAPYVHISFGAGRPDIKVSAPKKP